jgi:hypothetical protein
MKQRIPSSIAILLLLVSTTVASAGEKVFAWNLTTDDATVYLVGSIHLADSSIYPLDPAIEMAFELSEKLVVEADINSPEAAGAQMAMLTQGMYPAGKNLKSEVANETYTKTADYLATLGMPIELMGQFRPWALAMTLSAAALMNAGLDPSQGVDLHFLNKATTRGMEIVELEGVQFQIDLLAGWPDREQERFLLQTIDQMGQLDQLLPQMLAAWKEGDADALNSISADDGNGEFSFIIDEMYTKRNRAMAEKISGYMDEGGVWFVVVGSGHLVGDAGTVALLKEQGFEVDQMNATSAHALSQ